MKKNIGNVDRLLRAIIGVIILVIGIVVGSWWGLVGLLPLGTAIVGYCPPYALLGVNTVKSGKVQA